MIPLGYEDFVKTLASNIRCEGDWCGGRWTPTVEHMPRRPQWLLVESQENGTYGLMRGEGGWKRNGTPAPPVEWDRVADDLPLPQLYDLVLVEIDRLTKDHRPGRVKWDGEA